MQKFQLGQTVFDNKYALKSGIICQVTLVHNFEKSTDRICYKVRYVDEEIPNRHFFLDYEEDDLEEK